MEVFLTLIHTVAQNYFAIELFLDGYQEKTY